MANLKATLIETTVVVVANDHPPEPDAWDAYMTLLSGHLDARGDQPGNLIVFSGGGTPDSGMRLRLRNVARGRIIRTAVVSDSTMVRAIIGVFSLFVDGTRPFAAGDWQEALSYGGLAPQNTATYLPILRQLDADVGGSRALEALLTHNRSR